jgi:hypothetical protein
MIRERASFTESSHGPRLIDPAGVLFTYPAHIQSGQVLSDASIDDGGVAVCEDVLS